MSRMLLHSRRAAMSLVALLLLVAGGWASWGTAQHVMLAKGREHGTITVDGCGEQTCSGRFAPDSAAASRPGLTIDKSVAVKKGAKLSVVVKPGTDEVVRRGTGGIFHAWLPLGGALLLAAVIIGGGVGLPRVAWTSAGIGGVVLVGTFVTL
ncbi:hypothetical protein GCM10010387_16850 [Streptomyces inusitatus]|uniref:Uncharacterized protein n=1 Tax=Streptomyces inusitatus TaxID=68221 RepID=A0A918PXB6_9ACTN|nr:hypothetical protein [Streptomyces inusitatus]GGZ24158.1 hypothetical protein GCM10010387_16850 [Streptomyces inusitatus]